MSDVPDDWQSRFFDLSIEMLCVATAEGYFVRPNPRWTEVLGWSLDELKAKPFLEFVHEDDREDTLTEAGRLQEPGTSTVTFTNRYMKKGGGTRWLQWSARVVDGLFYAVARDVTELREARAKLMARARDLELANEELDLFAYAASHDLRGPLRGIITLTELIGEDLEQDPEAAREMLERLQGRATRLTDMVERLLRYVWIGRGATATETIALGSFVESVIELVPNTSGLTITHSGSAKKIEADPNLLQHVLLNLMTNAALHNDQPEGTVEVRYETSGNEVKWTVRDNGPGIATKDHDSVFKVFKVLGKRDDRRGAGVGLAVVKKLVERAGGNVWLESELGEGATFGFTWPTQPKPE